LVSEDGQTNILDCETKNIQKVKKLHCMHTTQLSFFPSLAETQKRRGEEKLKVLIT